MPTDPDPLAEHYENLDRGTLAKQGADRLAGHARHRVQALHARLWTLVWLIIGTVILMIGGFYLWVLYQAYSTGSRVADLREAAFQSIIGGDESDETPDSPTP